MALQEFCVCSQKVHFYQKIKKRSTKWITPPYTIHWSNSGLKCQHVFASPHSAQALVKLLLQSTHLPNHTYWEQAAQNEELLTQEDTFYFKQLLCIRISHRSIQRTSFIIVWLLYAVLQLNISKGLSWHKNIGQTELISSIDLLIYVVSHLLFGHVFEKNMYRALAFWNNNVVYYTEQYVFEKRK